MKYRFPKEAAFFKPNVELALNILRRVLGSKSYHNFIQATPNEISIILSSIQRSYS
jgi:hypothetical protein|tara:strand:- start:330 stop:497 length:168 start_codon:yes stop_codon:yes gene_type:complete